jgi:hypothetical protein
VLRRWIIWWWLAGVVVDIQAVLEVVAQVDF